MKDLRNELQTDQKKIVVLIDAENISPSNIEDLLIEIAKYGVANVKRIYGDWTIPQMKSWKKNLLKFGINPFQQFRYTQGKNSTDSALIIDAMDLLYTKTFDIFCDPDSFFFRRYLIQAIKDDKRLSQSQHSNKEIFICIVKTVIFLGSIF